MPAPVGCAQPDRQSRRPERIGQHVTGYEKEFLSWIPTFSTKLKRAR
jgi:hypothetical protein